MAPPEKEKGAPDERTPSNRFESFYGAADTRNRDGVQAVHSFQGRLEVRGHLRPEPLRLQPCTDWEKCVDGQADARSPGRAVDAVAR
jgi:hypothetical protein